MIKQKILILTLFICISKCLKLSPLARFTQQTFQKQIKCDLQSFLNNGSSINTNFFLLFKIPNCRYCQQAQVLFHNLYIEYNRRFTMEPQASKNELQSNIVFAEIDCNQSSSMCNRINVPHYPYHLIFQSNGQACSYEGGPLPGNMIAYLQQRKIGNKYEQCKQLGRLTFASKILSYFEPITNLFTQNVVLFIVAFVVGPFLFGYVFSRTKKNKQQVTADAAKEQKTE